MPAKKVIARARKDARQGKSPSTQAGEFVREEIHHIRQGKHGARNTKQAIAIGLSEARRAGVKIASRVRKAISGSGTASPGKSESTRPQNRPSAKRSRASEGALKREGRSAASTGALSRQAKQSAAKRGSASRSQAARKAVRTKGPTVLRQAARKAARTRSAA